MVDPITPVGRRAATQPAHIEPIADRRSVHDAASSPPAPAVPAVSPATVVQFSDGVLARHETLSRRGEGRGGRRVNSTEDARVQADRARAAIRGDGSAAILAQANVGPERVFALL
jgi:hypothetical protein